MTKLCSAYSNISVDPSKGCLLSLNTVFTGYVTEKGKLSEFLCKTSKSTTYIFDFHLPRSKLTNDGRSISLFANSDVALF